MQAIRKKRTKKKPIVNHPKIQSETETEIMDRVWEKEKATFF